MRIHKTHAVRGDWSYDVKDSEMSLVQHDRVTYGTLDKVYYLDTKEEGSKVRWTRGADGEREIFVVVSHQAFALTSMFGTETLQERLSIRVPDGRTLHDVVKAEMVPGSRLATRIRSVTPAMPDGMMTRRGFEDTPHLFPSRDFGPYRLSLQGSIGHACQPKSNLDRLEAYDAVEVAIYGPGRFGGMIHPAELGLGSEVSRYFGDVPTEDTTVLGASVPWRVVRVIEEQIRKLAAEGPQAPSPGM